MTDKKTIFVAFAIEDERQRDFLKGQSLNTDSPFEYIDMSVKKPCGLFYTFGTNSRHRISITKQKIKHPS